MNWQTAITTVLPRLDSHLPRTIDSLGHAGFAEPRLFVDGCDRPELYRHFGLITHCRPNPVGNFGNWRMALEELWHADPSADLYAVFEDDILAVGNLREYLEQSLPAANAYFNLFLGPANEAKAKGQPGWFPSHQDGRGALGLVFRNETVPLLLASERMARHPLRSDGRWKVDGAIIDSLKKHGVKEFCHYPSLLQHCGERTTIPRPADFWAAASFPGEDFDAMSYLEAGIAK